MIPFIVIVGPTAVGKSDLALRLAKEINGEIISGDSVQVYQKLDIGSAKPSLRERQEIKHHLIDVLDPAEPFTAAQFQKIASKLVSEIKKQDKVPILVGGTGLYVRSLLDPYQFQVDGSGELREKWAHFLKEYGKERLYQALVQADPESARRLHPNDTVRVMRALEVFDLTGEKMSSRRQNLDKSYAPLDPSIVYIGLSAPRETLYERINQRCDHMLQNGLIQEILNIMQAGYSLGLKPLQSIGYRHGGWFVNGLVSKEEMVRLLKRDTRRFAKRQLTWFQRDPRITWYDISQISPEELTARILKTCRAIKTRVE
ncbi:tRNA (adenosine(37)-N6)-dimethylallyltransferase MiaA [Paradesulfitobacterium ferrireducens]|uniref:tRNA (adenosine(37)-N6)-dimethylallyltransferase MiaA n=1 Tax=Paradesulfitobacterium ferrireducens TaxID=2816476 RepID=UPI001A8D8D26|nr:tRNA (adenosine(37)-N6)-dimethylallyltransferase MiaA [Paradesulfitobacterium ferrireducens]